MKFLKKCLEVLFEPFMTINLSKIEESLAKFFTKYTIVIYIISLAITASLVYAVYY